MEPIVNHLKSSSLSTRILLAWRGGLLMLLFWSIACDVLHWIE